MPQLENIREEKPCIICESSDFDKIYEWQAESYLHDKFETSSWDGRQALPLTVGKCSQCGLVYTRPSFKKDSLHLVYPDDIIPENLNVSQLMSETKWDDLIATTQSFLPSGSSICDIGTRYGVLVEKLRTKGFNAFGVELNPQAVKSAEDLGIKNVFESDIEHLEKVTSELGLDSVNGFIMDDVLEHLVNPVDEIRILSRLQASGDYLFLRQMDYDSLGRKVFRKKWYYYQPAAHMYFFDERSVKNLMEKLGYEIELIKKGSFPKHLKFFFISILRRLGFRRFMMPYTADGKDHYLNKRYHLDDMFLVVARKK